MSSSTIVNLRQFRNTSEFPTIETSAKSAANCVSMFTTLETPVAQYFPRHLHCEVLALDQWKLPLGWALTCSDILDIIGGAIRRPSSMLVSKYTIPRWLYLVVMPNHGRLGGSPIRNNAWSAYKYSRPHVG